MITLGIMNGTSGDAVDYVLVDIEFKKKLNIRFIQHWQKEFPTKIKSSLQNILTNKATTYELGEFQHDLGRMYAQQFAELKLPKKLQPQLVGLHGQTVYHRGAKATWQLGEPSYLAKTTNVPVIFNFRAADVALGGQGAPLAPIFHKALLQNEKSAAFHNLGGISNLTYCDKKNWLAFDTGPANILMDTWMQIKTKNKFTFDNLGKTAAQGLPYNDSLEKMLTHPFLNKKPPKSCGREEFNEDFLHKFNSSKFFRLSLEDQMSTLCEFTALSIFNAYKKYCPQVPEKIFFSGGGTQNQFLMHRLKIYFGNSVVKTSADLGWPTQAIEGAAFALLAYLRVYEQPLDLKTITGSTEPVLLGQMCEL